VGDKRVRLKLKVSGGFLVSNNQEGKAAEDSAPYTHLVGRGPVAQTSSLLYRGFPIRQRCEVRKPCRLAAVAPKRRYGAPRRRKVGDTAGLETQCH